MIGKTSSRCSSSNASPAPRGRIQPFPQRLKSIAACRALRAAAAFASLLVAHSQAASQEIEYRSLPDLVQQGSDAFARGEFPVAARAFHAIIDNYQEEPAWQTGRLPRTLLPLAGFASLRSGRFAEAADALALYLDDYADDRATAAFARYALASSLFQQGETDAARHAFQTLRNAAAQTAFRDLATLQQARLSPDDEAIALLEDLLAAPTSQRVATHAKLELVRLRLEAGQPDLACTHLLDTDWNETAMPELATLSWLALRLGDALLPSHPAHALQAYRWVSLPGDLIAKQQRRIEELETLLVQNAPTLGPVQAVWTDFYRQTLHALRRQLDALREAPDYTESLRLRQARCFAALNRPIEAWLLIEPIATGSGSLAHDAHLQWIELARQIEAWSAAASLAQRFLEAYPDSDDADRALYWIALALIEQEAYLAAQEALRSLASRSSEPAFQASARYYDAYCSFQLAHRDDAERRFAEAAAIEPDSLLAGQANLWIGICQFADNRLDQASQTFQSVAATAAFQPLHPEARYRQIVCAYVSGDLSASRSSLADWLDAYPLHPRHAEAALLHGDVLRELGETGDAIAAYQSLQTDDPELAFLAARNAAELLLDSGRPDDARDALETFLESVPLPPHHVGEAFLLYALLTATPEATLLDGIARYGNTPEARGILDLLHALPDRAAAALRHENPPAQSDRSVFASRLILHHAQSLERQNAVSHSKRQRLRLVSDFAIDELAPEALLAAGDALAEIGSTETATYFERVLANARDPERRAAAHHGLAAYYHSRNDPETATSFFHRIERDLLPPSRRHDALLLGAGLHQDSGRLLAASELCHELLADRSASPSAKSQALLVLGRIALEQQAPEKAYQFFQRVFTLYRGETDQVAQAYVHCVTLLYSMNRYTDAIAVCQEFLAQADLATLPAYRQAESLLPELLAALPPPSTPASHDPSP